MGVYGSKRQLKYFCITSNVNETHVEPIYIFSSITQFPFLKKRIDPSSCLINASYQKDVDDDEWKKRLFNLVSWMDTSMLYGYMVIMIHGVNLRKYVHLHLSLNELLLWIIIFEMIYIMTCSKIKISVQLHPS